VVCNKIINSLIIWNIYGHYWIWIVNDMHQARGQLFWLTLKNWPRTDNKSFRPCKLLTAFTWFYEMCYFVSEVCIRHILYGVDKLKCVSVRKSNIWLDVCRFKYRVNGRDKSVKTQTYMTLATCFELTQSITRPLSRSK
jgi:hypothetical protein